MDKVKLKDICKPDSSNLKLSDIENNSGNYEIYGASGIIKTVDFYKQEKECLAIVKDGAGVGRVFVLPPKSSAIGTMQYIIPNENVNVRYLYYFVKSLNLSKYITGATIPHIYFKIYGEEKSKIYDLKTQKKIVEELDKINEIIDKKKQQLADFDSLIKSQFIEMFGDIENNDKKFNQDLLKNNVVKMHIGPFGSALKTSFYVPKEKSACMVYEQKHAIQKTLSLDNNYVDQNKYEELKRFEVKPRDLIVSCRGTLGQVFTIPENAPIGIIHPSLMLIRLNFEKYNEIFFKNMLSKLLESDVGKGNCIKMGITAGELGKKNVILPPIELQNKFADFVKHIDKLKFDIKNNIAKLEMLLASRMQHYFGEK